MWVRLDKIVAVREGQRNKTSYVALENLAEEIWVPEPIGTTLVRIGWTR